MDTRKLVVAAVVMLGMAGCSTTPEKSVPVEQALERQCNKGLDVAYEELDFSKANGFGGSWEYTKAASLLGAAKVQAGFGGYNGCIDKVKTARAYISQSSK